RLPISTLFPYTTLFRSNPLYIVDGVAVGNIDYLSSGDIESIDVLKDAASAAIYGSRAANGVVLVTTRQGTKSKQAQVHYETYYGDRKSTRLNSSHVKIS